MEIDAFRPLFELKTRVSGAVRTPSSPIPRPSAERNGFFFRWPRNIFAVFGLRSLFFILREAMTRRADGVMRRLI